MQDVEAADEAFRKHVALVVDDSTSQRMMLRLLLKKWNFEVLEAESGERALQICRDTPVDFVITDWMMDGLSGPELCAAVRRLDLEHYVYFILLTSKTEKHDVALGLDAGADDFLSKPMDAGELKARMRAGERILTMQEDMADKNRRMSEAFERLNGLYQRIDQDLKAAARLQKTLIPEPQTRCGPVNIGILYKPAGHVGGDLVGFFEAAVNRVIVYAIDVSGHGVSSALMTARLSNLFSDKHLDENVGIKRLPNGEHCPRDPARVAAELNNRLQDETDSDQYFTMLYADINLDTGEVLFCQAGHPSPAVVRRDGTVEFAGEGGLPIGLVPDVDYETERLELGSGDRLMMYSDGITECESPAGEMLDGEGLSQILSVHALKGERSVLEAVLDDVVKFSDSDAFDDDVSALLLTMP